MMIRSSTGNKPAAAPAFLFITRLTTAEYIKDKLLPLANDDETARNIANMIDAALKSSHNNTTIQ